MSKDSVHQEALTAEQRLASGTASGDWTGDDLKNAAQELFCAGSNNAHFVAATLLQRGFRVVSYQVADAGRAALAKAEPSR